MQGQPDDPGPDHFDYLDPEGETPEVERRMLLAREGKWWWPSYWLTPLKFAKLYGGNED